MLEQSAQRPAARPGRSPTKVQTWLWISVYPGPEGTNDSAVHAMLDLLNSFPIMELKARSAIFIQVTHFNQTTSCWS